MSGGGSSSAAAANDSASRTQFVAERGDRFEIPANLFTDAPRRTGTRKGVVTGEERRGTSIWFEGDKKASSHDLLL